MAIQEQRDHISASQAAPGWTNHGTTNLVLPPAPRSSADHGMQIPAPGFTEDLGELPEGPEIDVFAMSPIAALKILCSFIEDLVQITGDVPPTPPVSLPTGPKVQLLHAEKQHGAGRGKRCENSFSGRKPSCNEPEEVDGVPIKKTPIGSPEAGPTEPFHIVGSNMEPLYIQHGAITRKFYSKKPPPIPLEEYLLRLHKYCPMSTAVYLATSLYVHRLAVFEQIIPVTGRNAHRLMLAGLRVAMKALEDLSYPHARFAKVGGVSQAELGRLEVSFCFLTNFELKVDEEMLRRQVLVMRDGRKLHHLPLNFQPMLPVMKSKLMASVPSNVLTGIAGVV
ncbi:hypothetical protein MMC14_005304 [Varicellaria rhodocarpa]|nr:hypothetical protein [Varicellaria rhodocarpa]